MAPAPHDSTNTFCNLIMMSKAVEFYEMLGLSYHTSIPTLHVPANYR